MEVSFCIAIDKDGSDQVPVFVYKLRKLSELKIKTKMIMGDVDVPINPNGAEVIESGTCEADGLAVFDAQVACNLIEQLDREAREERDSHCKRGLVRVVSINII